MQLSENLPKRRRKPVTSGSSPKKQKSIGDNCPFITNVRGGVGDRLTESGTSPPPDPPGRPEILQARTMSPWQQLSGLYIAMPANMK